MDYKKLEALRRESLQDPENFQAWLRALHARARAQGEGVYLELLKDLSLWSESPPGLQDAAIAVVKRRLSSFFEHRSTKVYECEGLAFRIASFVHKETQMDFQLIPGHYYAVEPETTDKALATIRQVLNVPPFLIGQCPVTQSAWDRVTGEDMSLFRDDDLPVNKVNIAYLKNWLTQTKGLRMPEEMEWMLACRGGRAAGPFWGKGDWRKYCWSAGRTYSTKRVEPYSVTLHKESESWNAFGLIDTIGNVEECVLFDRSGDPTCVVKGGSWKDSIRQSAIESRRFPGPYRRAAHIGFRACASIPGIQ